MKTPKKDKWAAKNAATEAIDRALECELGDPKGLLTFVALARCAKRSTSVKHVGVAAAIAPTCTDTVIRSDGTVVGTTYVSMSTQARMTGLSIAGVRRGIAWCEGAGLVEVIPREEGRSNLYRLHYAEVERRWRARRQGTSSLSPEGSGADRADAIPRRAVVRMRVRGARGRFAGGAQHPGQVDRDSGSPRDREPRSNRDHEPRSLLTATTVKPSPQPRSNRDQNHGQVDALVLPSRGIPSVSNAEIPSTQETETGTRNLCGGRGGRPTANGFPHLEGTEPRDDEPLSAAETERLVTGQARVTSLAHGNGSGGRFMSREEADRLLAIEEGHIAPDDLVTSAQHGYRDPRSPAIIRRRPAAPANGTATTPGAIAREDDAEAGHEEDTE